MRYLFTAILIFSAITSAAMAASLPRDTPIKKAKLLHMHGLTEDAKRLLIDTIFYNDISEIRAAAHYEIGVIAADEGNTDAAVSAWQTVITEYPSSEFCELAQQGLNELPHPSWRMLKLVITIVAIAAGLVIIYKGLLFLFEKNPFMFVE